MSARHITRAGLIPYCYDTNGQLVMAFMVPSDGAYGGLSPQIAKGQIDAGETEIEAALREGAEELGVTSKHFCTNPPCVWRIPCSQFGDIALFAVEVNTLKGFQAPHYETSRVVFLTADEFSAIGRDWQRSAVRALDHILMDI